MDNERCATPGKFSNNLCQISNAPVGDNLHQTMLDENVSRRLRCRVHREKWTAHSSRYFSKIVEIKRTLLRRAAIFVSNVPIGEGVGVHSGGGGVGEEKWEKKCAPRNDFTDKQKMCPPRVKETRFRNCICWFSFMLCSKHRVITYKQKLCSPHVKKERVSANMSVDRKTWFSCNRGDHPDAMRVWGDRNQPVWPEFERRGGGRIKAQENVMGARASIMFSRASIAWIVPIVPTTPASAASSLPPRLKIDTIATIRRIFNLQTSYNLHCVNYLSHNL